MNSRRGRLKVARRSLLGALCATALLAAIGSAPASADVCGGLQYYGSPIYLSKWRAAGVEIVDPINRYGVGKSREWQQRWHDRKAYRVCWNGTRAYHLHYNAHGEDRRWRFCYLLMYFTTGCSSWQSTPWRSVAPGINYTHRHWI